MIAAANEGQLLIHCTVKPSGQLDFNMKVQQSEKLSELEMQLQVMAQSGETAPSGGVNILDLF